MAVGLAFVPCLPAAGAEPGTRALKAKDDYGTIGVEYTPYLKTGIYHPEWNLNDERKRLAYEREKPVTDRKEILVTDLKVGRGDAGYEAVVPPPLP